MLIVKLLASSLRLVIPIQFKIARVVLKYFGFTFVINENEECDSTLAYLAKLFNSKDKEVMIISNDHDMYQCLNEKTSMMICHTGVGEEIFTERKFIEKHNLIPEGLSVTGHLYAS